VFLDGNTQENFVLMPDNVRQRQKEDYAILVNYCI